MYDFIILTTALTRPDLHQRIFPRNLQFVDGLSIKWLINIDGINNNCSINDTIEHFKVMFSGAMNIDTEFLYTEGTSCFFSATKRLTLRAHELLAECKTGVLWLEDDWEINQKTAYTQLLSDLRLKRTNVYLKRRIIPCPGTLKQKKVILDAQGYSEDAFWFVSLVPRVGVSFNPGIWSKAMFAQGFYEKLVNVPENQIDDPETLCADPFNAEYAGREIAILADPIFQDAGRFWSAEVGLEKWEKDQSTLHEQGAVTYNKKLNNANIDNKENSRLVGFFLLPDLRFNSPLKLVVRTVYEKGRLKVRLLAVPFFSFELKVTEFRETVVYVNRIHPWSQIFPFDKLPVQISWHFDNATKLLDTIEVKSPIRNFIAEYNNTIPLCSIWMLPIQAIAGGIIYIVSLMRTTKSLKDK